MARVKPAEDAEKVDSFVANFQRMLMVTSSLDTDVLMFEDVDSRYLPGRTTTRGPALAPTFSVGEVAKIFFGRRPAWLRWAEINTGMKFEGKRVLKTRVDLKTHRSYTLGEVELIAHSLEQSEVIDGAQLYVALVNVRSIALLWGLPIKMGKPKTKSRR